MSTAALMRPAQDAADIEQRILDAIAKADSKHPARVDTVIARLGTDVTDSQAALDRLLAQRRVVQAVIQRPPEPAWQAVWPTHIVPRNATWATSNALLYERGPAPPRLPARPDPERDPRPDLGYATAGQKAQHATKPVTKANMTDKKRKAQERRDTAKAMIAGRTLADAVPLEDIAVALQISQEGARYAVMDLERAGLAKRVTVGRGTRRRAVVFDPAADPQPALPASADTHVMRDRHVLPQQIAAVLRGIDRNRALTTAQVCASLPQDGVPLHHASVNKALAKMLATGAIACDEVEKPAGTFGPRLRKVWWDPNVPDAEQQTAAADPDETAAHQPAEPQVEPQYEPDEVAFRSTPHAECDTRPRRLTSAEHFLELAPDNAPDDRAHFALFCSGELGIVCGPHYLLLPPSAVRRLAALIGVSQGGSAA